MMPQGQEKSDHGYIWHLKQGALPRRLFRSPGSTKDFWQHQQGVFVPITGGHSFSSPHLAQRGTYPQIQKNLMALGMATMAFFVNPTLLRDLWTSHGPSNGPSNGCGCHGDPNS